ncbi:hypothetical protein DPMN_176731 [Dreissena polymorpha]|uniref:Uncharacterized protein n=1 Tax=Dreissena polymorpha TaxID=45954 RepID=A0A9D4EA02_DREPO|nr:hypothetical protein DPMN_176731 [Dreissena polymorpha]
MAYSQLHSPYEIPKFVHHYQVKEGKSNVSKTARSISHLKAVAQYRTISTVEVKLYRTTVEVYHIRKHSAALVSTVEVKLYRTAVAYRTTVEVYRTAVEEVSHYSFVLVSINTVEEVSHYSFALVNTVEVYRTISINISISTVEVYRTSVEVYRTTVEVYRTTVEVYCTIVEVYRTTVEVYRTCKHRSSITLAVGYRTINTVEVVSHYITLVSTVEVYRTTVEVYRTTVEVYRTISTVEVYRTTVEKKFYRTTVEVAFVFNYTTQAEDTAASAPSECCVRR